MTWTPRAWWHAPETPWAPGPSLAVIEEVVSVPVDPIRVAAVRDKLLWVEVQRLEAARRGEAAHYFLRGLIIGAVAGFCSALVAIAAVGCSSYAALERAPGARSSAPCVTLVDAYEPDARALESQGGWRLDASWLSAVLEELAPDVDALGLGPAAPCLEGALFVVPVDDASFEDVCGAGALACRWPPAAEWPYALDGAYHEVVLSRLLGLVSRDFARPVVRHELIHRALECATGDGDADHAHPTAWALEGW